MCAFQSVFWGATALLALGRSRPNLSCSSIAPVVQQHSSARAAQQVLMGARSNHTCMHSFCYFSTVCLSLGGICTAGLLAVEASTCASRDLPFPLSRSAHLAD